MSNEINMRSGRGGLHDLCYDNTGLAYTVVVIAKQPALRREAVLR